MKHPVRSLHERASSSLDNTTSISCICLDTGPDLGLHLKGEMTLWGS